MNAGAFILAAGKSERFGSPKVLQSFLGEPFTVRIVQNLCSAGIAEEKIVLVLGHRFNDFRAKLPELGAVKIIDNPNYELGQFSSIQAGIETLAQTDAAGAAMCLVDQPHLQKTTFQQVLEVAADNPDNIIIPTYNQRGGHPVFIPKSLFQVILEKSAENNLRTVFNAHQHLIMRVPVDDPGLLRDTDYPEDLQAVESLYRS